MNRSVWLVARREIVERTRSKAFLVGNLIVILIVVAIVVAQALAFGNEGPLRVGIVGVEAGELAAAAEPAATSTGVALATETLPDRAAAEAALRDGRVDVALIDGQTLLSEGMLRRADEALFFAAAQRLALARALDDAGIPPADREELLSPSPLRVETLTDPDESDSAGFLVALVAATVLYGMLILYIQWVAQGVVEEKTSRVVEVLLATVRPSELLVGKVVGIGLLGLAQIAVTIAAGVIALLITGSLEIPTQGWTALALVVAWFVPGYALYGMLSAVAGALVNRTEDLQVTTTPMVMVLVVAFFVAQFAAMDPLSPLARIGGFVPFWAPLVQPLRAAAGAVPAWEMAVSLVITLATIALLVPLAARLYAGGALRVDRRIGLREAWRTAADRRW
ncbi:MAG: ABC transporter permease [Egibacteraceae bacterium]